MGERQSLNARDLRIRGGTQGEGGDEEGTKDPEQVRALVEICKLGRDRRWQEALLVLSTVPEPCPKLRTAALNACVKSSQLEQAKKVFEDMPTKSVAAYNTFMTLFGRLKRIQDVERLLQEMETHGVKPSGVTYGCLVSAYGAVKDLPSVMRVLREMMAASQVPSEVTYASAIAACARVGDHDQAQSLMLQMAAAGMSPGVEHFTSLIASCAQNKDETKAREHVAEMLKCSISLNLVSYTSLLGCIGGDGAIQRGEAVLAEMLQSQVEPDTFLYNALLKITINARDPAKARQVLAELSERGLQRNRETGLEEKRLLLLEQELQEPAPGLVTTSPLPEGWHQTLDPTSGHHYYWRAHDPATTTTWTRPAA